MAAPGRGAESSAGPSALPRRATSGRCAQPTASARPRERPAAVRAGAQVGWRRGCVLQPGWV